MPRHRRFQRHPRPWTNPWFYVWYVLYWTALGFLIGSAIFGFTDAETTPPWAEVTLVISQNVVWFLGAYALAARRIFLPDPLESRGFEVVQRNRTAEAPPAEPR